MDADAALTLLNDAITAAKEAGLPWDGVVDLTPSAELIELVHRSQKPASDSGAELA